MGRTNIYMTVSDDLGGFGSGVHSDAIEILGFDVEVKQVGSEIGGKPRSVEAVVPGSFNVKKAVDGASPLLFRWCCIGEWLASVTISCYATINDPPYMVYEMKGVHIASWKPSSGGGLPTESIGLKYAKLAVKYNEAGLGDAVHGNDDPAGAVEKEWNWVVELPV